MGQAGRNPSQGFQFLGLKDLLLQFFVHRNVDHNTVHPDKILFLIVNGNCVFKNMDQGAAGSNHSVFRVKLLSLPEAGFPQGNDAIVVFRMEVSGPYFVRTIHLLRGCAEDLFNRPVQEGGGPVWLDHINDKGHIFHQGPVGLFGFFQSPCPLFDHGFQILGILLESDLGALQRSQHLVNGPGHDPQFIPALYR